MAGCCSENRLGLKWLLPVLFGNIRMSSLQDAEKKIPAPVKPINRREV
jgi:hypothetical protein